MIVFSLTWDILGGQMGYNSLGNIFFFGAGMYISAVVQIGLFYDVGMYTSGARTTHIVFTNAQYFTGFALGTVAAGHRLRRCLPSASAGSCSACAAPISPSARSASRSRRAELIASWEWVGAASGISLPVFPGEPETQKLFFYFLLFGLAFAPAAVPALALFHQLRAGDQRDPRRRGEGGGHGPAHPPLQARRRW